MGGKWTTYRKMAQDVVDQVIESFQFNKIACKTAETALQGNISEKINAPEHLSFYGSDLTHYLEFEKSNPEYAEKIHPKYNFTKGQVIWSIQHEMARTVEDFLSRRIRLLLLDAKAAREVASIVASIMAIELEYPETWQQKQVTEFHKLTEKYILQ